MKLRTILFLFITAAQTLHAQHSTRNINFDSNWKFHLGHAADATKDFNYTIANIFSKTGKATGTAIDPNFDDSAWRTVNLPHDWAVELPFVFADNFDVMAHGYKPVGGLFPQNSIGWYRKEFVVEKADSGQRFTIRFDGIFRDANIWLNGFYLGNNKSGYIGVTYDVTDYINYDKKNVLVVRADASQYEGWFYEGAGIYRHVWMNKLNNVHLTEDTFVYTEALGNNHQVHIKATIENKNLQLSTGVFYAYIIDRNGNTVAQSAETPFFIGVHEKIAQRVTLNLVNPRLWSLEDPYLL